MPQCYCFDHEFTTMSADNSKWQRCRCVVCYIRAVIRNLVDLFTKKFSTMFRHFSRVLVQQSFNKPLPSLIIRLSSTKPEFNELVKNNKVVVFMKGVPEQPMCGFSNAVVQILRMHGVQYDSHNVLADEAIRQGINLKFQPFRATSNFFQTLQESKSSPTGPRFLKSSSMVNLLVDVTSYFRCTRMVN